MIKKIILKNWKNIDNLDLDFANGINFIIGANGTGKTSILEAINYGLCSSFKGIDLSKFIKKGCNFSEILINFSLEQKEFRIKHTIKPSNVDSTLEGEGLSISYKNNDVYNELENIFLLPKVSRQRILYIAEGEIHILASPFTQVTMLNKQFASELRTILGLEQITLLQKYFEDLKKRYDKETEEIRIHLGSAIDQKEVELIKERMESNQRNMKVLDSKRAQIKSELDKNQRKLGRIEAELENIKSTEYEFRKILKESEDVCKMKLSVKEIPEVIRKIKEELDKGIKSKSVNYRDIKSKLDETQGKYFIFKDLYNVLLAFKESTLAQKACPLCHQPLDSKRYAQLEKELLGKINQFEELISKLKIQSDEIFKQKKEEEEKLNKCIKILNSIQPIEKMIWSRFEVRDNILKLEIERREIKQVIESLNKKYRDTEEEFRNIFKINENDKNKLSNPIKENLENRLINITRRKLINEIILESLRDTSKQLYYETNEKILKKINEELKRFRLEEKGTVFLDESAIPYVKEGENIYDFDMLSGGERTALYILTRILLNNLISKSNFLLIDEPFEHLDSMNRKYLRDFLDDSIKKGYIFQLIITTYEETLTRTFLDRTDANLFYL
jgi:DNA repair exonuclease SbcCD ATPase subunit